MAGKRGGLLAFPAHVALAAMEPGRDGREETDPGMICRCSVAPLWSPAVMAGKSVYQRDPSSLFVCRYGARP